MSGVRSFEGWSAWQVSRLALMLAAGADYPTIAASVGKSPAAVGAKIKRLEKAARNARRI